MIMRNERALRPGLASTIEHVIVVIPARDEATSLPRCLTALQAAAVDRPLTGVVVVDDGSVDGTGDVAVRWIDRLGLCGVVERAECARVSTARTVGVRRAVSEWEVAADRTVVMSTDADTLVRSDWIDRHLAHHRGGAVAVAGVVAIDEAEVGSTFHAVWTEDYRAGFGGAIPHPHVHAANLSIRLDVYLEAGEFGSGPQPEDRDLWDRLRSLGHAPIADPDLVVDTSARWWGRVPDGFAAALRGLAEPAGLRPAEIT